LTAAALLAALLVVAMVPDVLAADLAAGKPCFDTGHYATGYECTMAFDTNDSTRWAVAAGQINSGNYVGVDLGSVSTVTAYRLLGLAGSSGCPTGSCWAASYKIQSCDIVGAGTCNGSDPAWTDRTGVVDGVASVDHSASLAAAVAARYWRALQMTAAYGLWTVSSFELQGVAGTALQMVLSGTAAAQSNAVFVVTAQVVTDANVDVTSSDTFTTTSYTVATGAGTLTCDGSGTFPHAWSGSTTSCRGVGQGVYTLVICDTLIPQCANWVEFVGNPPSSFAITGPRSLIVGQKGGYSGSSYDGINGVVVSATDSFVFVAAAHQTCATPILGGNPLGGAGLYYAGSCSWDLAGTYTLTATDSYGFTASLSVVVGAPSAASTCGSTDLGCWLNQLWDAVSKLGEIPFQVIQGIANFLLVSRSGKDYLDLSSVQVVPYITCRGGEVPSAPDGVHCYPFPFAIPGQLAAMFSVLLVTPVAPLLDWHIHQAFVDVHVPIDPQVLLTPTVMGWVRGIEYVLFVTALGMAVRKYIQMFGVD
jgi:hypothetical protein